MPPPTAAIATPTPLSIAARQIASPSETGSRRFPAATDPANSPTAKQARNTPVSFRAGAKNAACQNRNDDEQRTGANVEHQIHRRRAQKHGVLENEPCGCNKTHTRRRGFSGRFLPNATAHRRQGECQIGGGVEVESIQGPDERDKKPRDRRPGNATKCEPDRLERIGCVPLLLFDHGDKEAGHAGKRYHHEEAECRGRKVYMPDLKDRH